MKLHLNFLLLFLPILVSADSLKDLLHYAKGHNDLIVAKSIQSVAKAEDLKSTQSDYYPKVDVGGFYKRYDEANPILPGTIYSAYAKVSFDLYDGGKNSYSIAQKENILHASQYSHTATKRDIELSIVEDFFHIKSQESSLEALKDTLVVLSAQLQRKKSFYDAKLATSDEVDRLKAAYANIIYKIETLKFSLLSLRRGLELKVGKKITSLTQATFQKKSSVEPDELSGIRALRFTKKSLFNSARVIGSYALPQLKIEDTYNFYGYQNLPSIAGFEIAQTYNQNTILATLNMRLFDFNAINEAKKAVSLQGDALSREINYKTKEQKMQQELALQRITTVQLKIKSASSALVAAQSALKTITQKYDHAIVNNIVYLNALSLSTEAKSQYAIARNDLEIAYALYYYYNAKKLEEFINE